MARKTAEQKHRLDRQKLSTILSKYDGVTTVRELRLMANHRRNLDEDLSSDINKDLRSAVRFKKKIEEYISEQNQQSLNDRGNDANNDHNQNAANGGTTGDLQDAAAGTRGHNETTDRNTDERNGRQPHDMDRRNNEIGDNLPQPSSCQNCFRGKNS